MKNEVLCSEDIYQKVDLLRQSRGWTIYKLAKKATVSSTGINNWKNRKSQPTLYMLECLSDALEVPLLSLILDNTTYESYGIEKAELLKKIDLLLPSQTNIILNLLDEFLKSKI